MLWDWLRSAPKQWLALAVALLAFTCGLGFLLWVLALASVGRKYNVKDTQTGPLTFLLKSCCCLCLMNVRVGLHVDRAQGFTPANKYVMQMVHLTEHVRELELGKTPEHDGNGARWKAATGSEIFEGDEGDADAAIIKGLAEAEDHAARMSPGRKSRHNSIF